MTRPFLLVAAGLTLFPGCKSVSTQAVEGAVIRLFANPDAVPIGGSSTITISLFEASGQPVNDKTSVFLTTDLGRVDPESITVTGGFAQVTFYGGASAGTAHVRASSGAATAADLSIAVGGSATSITLVATPSELPVGGGTSTVVATVKTSGGVAVAGSRVSFTADQGSLASSGVPRVTNASGVASDVLTTSVDTTVTASVLGASAMATAAVDVAGTGAATLAVVASPETLAAGGGSSNLTATALDSFSRPVVGLPVVFQTDAGSLSFLGTQLTNGAGSVGVTLTTDRTASVTARAAGVSGSATVTVDAATVGFAVDLTVTPSVITRATPYPATVAVCADPTSFDITLSAKVTFEGNAVASVPVLFAADGVSAGGPGEVGRWCEFPSQATTDSSGVALFYWSLSANDYLICDNITTPCGTSVCPPGGIGQSTVNRCCCSITFSARAQGKTDSVNLPILIEANVGTKPCACVF